MTQEERERVGNGVECIMEEIERWGKKEISTWVLKGRIYSIIRDILKKDTV